MAKLDRLVWAASSTFHIGPHLLGVRSDSEWLDGLIRRALAEHHVPDVEAPANFSVVVPRDDSGSAAKGLNMLYEGHTNLVRSRHAGRVLRALFQHLSKHVPSESGGYLRVSDLALVRDNRSILVPRNIVTWMDQLAPRLNRAGWQFVDQPWSTIDLETGALVVPPATLEVDASWEAEISAVQSGREPGPVAPGRYRLSGWGVYSVEEKVMSRAAGVASTIAKVLNPLDFGVRDTLEAMIDLSGRISVAGLGSPFENDFATRLMEVDAG
jgi:hypothetical protein